MKKLLFLFVWVMAALAARAGGDSVIRVGVFIYPGVELLDWSGPMDVFLKAKAITKGKFEVFTVAETQSPVIIQDAATKVLPDYSITNMPPADILVIPGSGIQNIDSMIKDSARLALVKKLTTQAGITMSVCTGAYILAATGALNGKEATTHFFVADDFQEQHPEIRVIKDVRYVDAGNLITCSGVTSGIDGSLHLVERFTDKRIADMTARAVQYERNEKGTWPTAAMGMAYHHAKGAKTEKKDVVCGMDGDAAITYKYEGVEYYFCSATCRKSFEKNPKAYLKKK